MEEKICSACGCPLECGEIILSYHTMFRSEELMQSEVTCFSEKNLEKHNSMRITGEKKAYHCSKCRTVTILY